MSGSLDESSALIEKPEDLTPKKKRKQSVAEELNDCKKSRNDTVNTISLNEVINLRFPHIGEQIFETFDTPELTKCLKVSRTWFVLAGNVLIKRREGEFCKKLLEVWKRDASTDQYDTSDRINNPDNLNAIQRCIQSLVHACQCRDPNCQSMSCHKMKKVVSHVRQCPRKSSGGCPICKQFVALCCYHAKACQEDKCFVHWCENIKKFTRQQKLLEAAMIRRKMTQMYVRRQIMMDALN